MPLNYEHQIMPFNSILWNKKTSGSGNGAQDFAKNELSVTFSASDSFGGNLSNIYNNEPLYWQGYSKNGNVILNVTFNSLLIKLSKFIIRSPLNSCYSAKFSVIGTSEDNRIYQIGNYVSTEY